ncbi:MAG TPA: hypothetical protein VGF53_17380 [Pseudolabrys sp.]|jgi:hypothetical protein
MNRIWIAALVLAIGWSLPASADLWWDGVKGNDTGGIISWSPDHELIAPQWAAEHCAHYKKFAQITSIGRQYGNYIAFDCNWRPPLGYRPSRQD